MKELERRRRKKKEHMCKVNVRSVLCSLEAQQKGNYNYLHNYCLYMIIEAM